MYLEYLEKKEALLEVLQSHQLFLTKNRGQNFLVDLNMRKKLAGFLNPSTPLLLEIGPGLGHFTYCLQDKTQQLTLIEIDQGFIPILQKNFPRTNILHQDFLKTTLLQVNPHNTDYTICGNIPYLISTKIYEHILSWNILPTHIFFTVEKDFALEKLLSIQAPLHHKLEYFYRIELLQKIPKSCFFPEPKKDSAFVGLTLQKQKRVEDNEYLNYIEALFKNPKKTLPNNLLKYNLADQFWEENKNLKIARVYQLTQEEILDLFKQIKLWDKNADQK